MEKKLIFSIFLTFFFFFLGISPTDAAYFQLDPTTINVNANETFSVKININTEGEEVNSADIYLNFNSSLIEAQQVNAGSFFSTVTNNISAGTVYVAAMVDDPASPKNGSGEVATVTFKALANGSGEISFGCDKSLIVKADANGTNILNCSVNNKSTITVGGGTNSSTNNSNTSSQLPKTGIFDNLVKLGIPGLVLFLFGILGKVLLKY